MGYLAKVRTGIAYRKESLSSLKRCFSVLVIIFCVFQVSIVEAQFVFEQDIVQGGITAAGFSTGQGAGSGSFDIYIEPGSTIKKAYALSYTLRHPPIAVYNVNDMSFSFDTTNVIMNVGFYSPPSSHASPVRVYFEELTDEIVADVINFNVTIPSQLNLPINEGFWTFFLIVVYENPELNHTAYSILINDQSLTGLEIYAASQLNPIVTDNPVGFSLYTDRTGVFGPGTPNFHFEVNGEYLGLAGGSDQNSSSWGGSGVKGHFYYQNNELFGLDDDIPNESMNGSDALADISSYVTNQDTDLSFELRHMSYPNQNPASTNINLAYTLAYTTTCLPFESTLTKEVTICRGDTAQLLATGGSTGLPTAYEWLPQEDLSCYNCPNPVFTGDSSKVYTVRIWNTDSCSKVLPVKVNVLDAPHSANLSTTPATCSESNGNLIIGNISGGQPAYQYSLGAAWTGNATATIFSNLPSGDYTFYVRDQNQCYYSQDFTIDEINPAHAAFIANPQSGTEPLDVNFYNQSSGTNLYEWTLQDSVSNDFDFNFTFDSAGTYFVQLISWYNEPHCADTAMATIIVHPDYNHSIFAPTYYNTQHGDYIIETTNIQRVEFELYNTIGQHIYSTTLDVGDGKHALWNGNRHARGYYFYRIKFWDVQGLEFRERGKVLLVR